MPNPTYRGRRLPPWRRFLDRHVVPLLQVAALLVACGLFAVWVAVIGHNDALAGQLQASPDRSPGVVAECTGPGGRSSGTIVVTYRSAGSDHRDRIYLDDASPTYDRGQAVTVVIDPDDSSRFSIVGEENTPRGWLAVSIVLGVATVFALAGSVAPWFVAARDWLGDRVGRSRGRHAAR